MKKVEDEVMGERNVWTVKFRRDNKGVILNDCGSSLAVNNYAKEPWPEHKLWAYVFANTPAEALSEAVKKRKMGRNLVCPHCNKAPYE